MTTEMTIDTIERQKTYVAAQKEKSKGLGIVFAEAFLRGMRDIGYKNPAWALAELIDNSTQAGATTVAIRFGFGASNKSHAKPDMIALCDNGNGMIPEMISYAVRWGGTDREGDRTGFGRYGYGLPSSIVSLAKRYTVYAKAANSDWHSVTVDIEELGKAANDVEKTQELLSAKKAKLPTWVAKAAKDDDNLDLGSLESGTVIVLEDLDRLRKMNGWITLETLRSKLVQHFGVIYRHFIPGKRVIVDGVLTQAVDPLFLMEHGRLYDENSVRAEPVKTKTFEVESERGKKGKIRIRASVLPPNFQSADPADYRPDMRGVKNNSRFPIMRDYNGLMICRAGRQIDCISPKWTKFQNVDVNVKIEIDFDPELDEYFNITTAKQQIVIEDEMWEMLRNEGQNQGGLHHLVREMRARVNELHDELLANTANRQAPDAPPRPSSLAMEQTDKFKGPIPEPTPEQKNEGERNLEQKAAEEADATGQSKDSVLDKLKAKTSKQKWEVEFAAIPEGPFYRPYRLGEQKRVVINTEHPFHSQIYLAAADAKYGIEVLLFVLAERELDARGEAETFYKAERQKWSERLRRGLDQLVTEESMQDKASRVAEFMHAADAS